MQQLHIFTLHISILQLHLLWSTAR